MFGDGWFGDRLAYIYNIWNYVDWTNFLIWFLSFHYLVIGLLSPEPPKANDISETIGFQNWHEQFAAYSFAKQLLAINATLQVRVVGCQSVTTAPGRHNACSSVSRPDRHNRACAIQVLKITKFCNQLIPKMSLLSEVRAGLAEAEPLRCRPPRSTKSVVARGFHPMTRALSTGVVPSCAELGILFSLFRHQRVRVR